MTDIPVTSSVQTGGEGWEMLQLTLAVDPPWVHMGRDAFWASISLATYREAPALR